MRILFKIYPQRSHYNSTFSLARGLLADGHDVIYTVPEAFRSYVQSQGLAVVLDEIDLLPYTQQQVSRPMPLMLALKHLCGLGFSKRELEPIARSLLHGIRNQIDIVSPDLLAIDSPYAIFSLGLRRLNVPFAILESMVNLNYTAGLPPCDTSYVPNAGLLNRIITDLLWFRYRLKRRFKNRLLGQIEFNRGLLRHVLGPYGPDWSTVNFRRYFHIGLTDVPEILLSPPALDFRRRLAPNQFHIGSIPDHKRSDPSSDESFERNLPRLLKARENGTPIVYCSLGSTPWRFPAAKRFMRRLIRASTGSTWILVIAKGPGPSDSLASSLPDNVFIYNIVPQLSFLQNVALFITHGGMNSITESVLAGVPMLVYPGSSEVDQVGNGARIEYNKIGRRGSLRYDSMEEIRFRITSALLDTNLKINCLRMGHAIRAFNLVYSPVQLFCSAINLYYPQLFSRLPTTHSRRLSLCAQHTELTP